jgi:hypothetical protein
LNFRHEHGRGINSFFIEGTKKNGGGNVKFTGCSYQRRVENKWLIIIIFGARQVGFRRIDSPVNEGAASHPAVGNFKHNRLLPFVTPHLY